jgi:protein-tyrosine phosphatase
LKRRAALTSAYLSVLFMVVYGGTSYVTSLRSDVGTLMFDWERWIPFVPWLIVPYMSIDLFYVGAPFLCTSDEERRVFSRRISFAVLVAGTCFLLFPLRLARSAPAVPGVLGAIFAFLHGFDQPVNLVPSLHITLRAILIDTYARHSHGVRRVLLHVWFSLIGFSTLLTYQHHVVDVLTGFFLAAVCFHLFREDVAATGIERSHIAVYYATSAVMALAASIAFWPWGSLLLWPALSLGLVASGYFGRGSGVYRKAGGRLPLSTRFVLLPSLLGQRLSVLYYSRQCRAWDEVTPRLWIGRQLNEAEAAAARKAGVMAVLDLTAEFAEPPSFRAAAYRNVPVLDLTAPSPSQLDEAVAFIHEHTARGIVYVHCKIGYSRSAAVAGAYLLAHGGAPTVDEAIARMRRARPSLVVRPEADAALRRFAGTVRLSPAVVAR